MERGLPIAEVTWQTTPSCSDAPTGASASSRWSSSSRSSGSWRRWPSRTSPSTPRTTGSSGAAQEVAGELQSARSKAIMTNTNSGVSFVVVDKDSYRFVQEDLLPQSRPGGSPPAQASPSTPGGRVRRLFDRRQSRADAALPPARRVLQPRRGVRDLPGRRAVGHRSRTEEATLVDTSTSTGSTSESRAPARSWRSACGKPRPLSSGRCGSRRAAECCPSHEEPKHERHGS